MKNRRFLAPVFGALSVVGLASSQVSATSTCESGGGGTEAFAANGTNKYLTLQCGNVTPDVVNIRGYGLAVASSNGTVKGVTANKSGGVGTIVVDGLDASGNLVCHSVDSSANGIAGASDPCPTNVATFHVTATY